MTHLKTIKRKTLHHPEYYLTTRLKLRVKTEDFNAERACLSKYFPKYYRNLIIEIPAKDQSFETRLRQTKVIGHFAADSDDYSSGTSHFKRICELEQRVFRNKRKSVKSLPLFFNPSERKRFGPRAIPPSRPQFSSFFPRITSLNLSLIKELGQGIRESAFISRELEQKIKSSYGYFWNGLRYLEHLEISNFDWNFWFMVQEVNSSSHILSSLKKFKLSLSGSGSYLRDELHQLVKNGHLLNHVTHLDCKEFEMLYKFDEIMGSILAQCSKLVYLNIPIGREAQSFTDVKGIFPEHEGTQVFQQLSKMNKLHTLNVSAFGTNSFLQHFSVPPSVQKLSLYVGKSLRDTSWLDLFQEPQYNFFERWKGLSNLQTLKLKIRMIYIPNDLLAKFVNPLLESLQNSCLKKLRLQIVKADIYAYNDQEEALDFSLLLREESAVFKQLESLKILGEDMKITSDPKKICFLSGLKKLVIDGKFSKKFDSQSFLQGLVTSSSGDQPQQKNLKLSTFSFKSIEAFGDFLKLAKKGTRSAVLDLKIALFVDKDLKKLFNHFRQPINLGENCAMALTVWLMPPDPSMPKTKELPESDKNAFQQIFGDFKLKVIQKATYSGWNQTLLEF